jgi:hypothetical protein
MTIPADLITYPSGCSDPEWCRGNRCCFWHCETPDKLKDKRRSLMTYDHWKTTNPADELHPLFDAILSHVRPPKS